MKKLTVFVALALLAVAGTGYAVTCAYDNVPGATLLIPYFSVSGTVTGGYITTVGTDTKVSFTNVSDPGIIAHVTVWNKYSKAVLDFNVPMTGKDVAFFSMSDILNGKLNVNLPQYDNVHFPDDVCGVGATPAAFDPSPWIGWASNDFHRFRNPTFPSGSDYFLSVSKYGTPPGSLTDDAFKAFRPSVMASLDESGDIRALQTSAGANILDLNNPACEVGSAVIPDGAAAFSGYITVDVVNYCTNFFPDQVSFYENDAIATAGWGEAGYTPNVLIGDVFYVDPTANSGNISGDQAVALEFDARLNSTPAVLAPDTFFGRFAAQSACELDGFGGTTSPCGDNVSPATFRFGGDGREPLGDHYGFRYLSDTANGLRSWILVWRGDTVAVKPSSSSCPNTNNFNLCNWLCNGGPKGYGFYDDNHQLTVFTYDNDESLFVPTTPGGPSGGPPPSIPVDFFFLESQRVDLLTNGDINPSGFLGGWVDVTLRSPTYGGIYNQGWIGVQHTGPGTLLNVGHSATSLNGDFVCNPPIDYGVPPVGVFVGTDPATVKSPKLK